MDWYQPGHGTGGDELLTISEGERYIVPLEEKSALGVAALFSCVMEGEIRSRLLLHAAVLKLRNICLARNQYSRRRHTQRFSFRNQLHRKHLEAAEIALEFFPRPFSVDFRQNICTCTPGKHNTPRNLHQLSITLTKQHRISLQ